MYYYGYQNYAAGVIGILVLAVALTALLVVLVLPKEKDGHLPSVFQMLYDLFSPKTLVMEKLLQILYVFLTCLAVLYGIVVFFSGFFSGFQNLALGLVILAVGPILLRVGYELILLLVMQVKTTREIHQKLTQMTEERGPAAAPGRPQPAPETAAPAAENSAVPCREHHALSPGPGCGPWDPAASGRGPWTAAACPGDRRPGGGKVCGTLPGEPGHVPLSCLRNLVPGCLGPLPRLRQTAGRKKITVPNARRRPRVFLFGQGRSLYRSNHGAVNLTAPDCKRGSGTEAIVI